MMLARILSAWVTGDDGTISPDINPPGQGWSWTDVTGQGNVPGTPNSVIVELTCTTEQLAAVEAAGAYVLWSVDNG